MNKEDYVSFETATLLKEKGFDWKLPFIYVSIEKDKKVHLLDTIDNYNDDHIEYVISAPTLQMAMKWLREKHNLGVFPSWSQVFGCYGCRLYYLKKSSQELYSLGAHYDTYEEACEAGIKYCLENSI